MGQVFACAAASGQMGKSNLTAHFCDDGGGGDGGGDGGGGNGAVGEGRDKAPITRRVPTAKSL